MEKKINYMGLSELMRMIIIFVTFCLNKKKIPQGLRGKKYTNQFSLQSKGAVTVEDCWTECQHYDIVYECVSCLVIAIIVAFAVVVHLQCLVSVYLSLVKIKYSMYV